MSLRIDRLDVLAPTSGDRRSFDCGIRSLNDWFATRAGQSLRSSDAVTFVLHDDRLILGYYCVSSGSVERGEMPGPQGRGAPDPVPVVLMGRLAVSKSHQHQGFGRELLRHAIRGALAARENLGMRSMLVHALNEDAARFYRSNGFEPSPMNEFTLMLDLRSVSRTLRL